MKQTGNIIDGRDILIRSPFRCYHFLITTVIGLAAVSWDAYLINRYWNILSTGTIVLMSLAVGAQIIYQWWRTLLCYGRLRRYASAIQAELSGADNDFEMATRMAAGGIAEALLFCFFIILMEVIVIGALLAQIENLRPK
jgi:hypothetical protein